MNYFEMKEILLDLNKKWGLDFVSATSGDCCNTCGNMMTKEEDDAWGECKTFLMVKWFFDGMNYCGSFEKQDKHFIRYDLGNIVSIDRVCKDLQNSLKNTFNIIKPNDTSECIKLIKIN